MILVNGIAEDRIPVSDRGLQYGDGLFETIAYRNGVAEYLDLHLERLLLGCEKLAIQFHDIELLKREIAELCSILADEDAVIKVIVTRGSGGRGYYAVPDIVATRIISSHPFPIYPSEFATNGIAARFCQHVLSENPVLAGIKHLNRLDQVLARNEWSDSSISEGLMSDNRGNVVEGTMSNLFIVINNQLITSPLINTGIAGVVRGRLLELAQAANVACEQRSITQADIKHAQEVFVCNSVIGIWPIRLIEQTSYEVGPVTQLLQSLLAKSPK